MSDHLQEFIGLMNAHINNVESYLADPEYERAYVAKHGIDAWLELQNYMLDHVAEIVTIRDNENPGDPKPGGPSDLENV